MNANACGKTLFLFLGAVLLFGMVGCTTAGGGGAGNENVNENDNVTTNGNFNDNEAPDLLPTCGNGQCDAAEGEDCSTCPDDCGECPTSCQDDAECNDDNACTDDVCNEEGECARTAIEGCCTADADCAEGENCDESSHECVVGPGEIVATPTFTPSDGPFTDFVNVTLSSATAGASIRYTIDGSTPAGSGLVYTAPIHLAATATIRAIAYKTGMTDSEVTSATFTKQVLSQVATPAFSPPGSTFADSIDVTISCATAGASIRYTTDGSTPTASQGTPYTAPVRLTATTTLQAIASAAGMTESQVQSVAYTKAPPRVEAPTFSPNGGTFVDSVDLTISCATAGASIRYTTDGSTPSASQGTAYTAPIHLTATTTVRAVAYKTGMTDSEVTSATFTKQALSQVATPVFSPPDGTFADSIDVTISCATAGASIRYTTDGSTPSASQGTAYTAQIPLTTTTILKAVAYKTGMTESTVTSATFTIESPSQVATPTFSPLASTFADSVDVTISCATALASIRYTTDGSTPSASQGTAYTAPVHLTATTTLKAVAYVGSVISTVASGTYTKQAPSQVATPTFTPVGGTFAISINVTISCATPGASIRYTKDGSTPTASQGTVYTPTAPVHLTATTTLKAIAYKTGMTNSAVTSGTYTKGNIDTVLIPAGEFQMGDTFSAGQVNPEGYDYERPVHPVYIDAFFMDPTEVTNAQYKDALNWAKAQGNLITVNNGLVCKYNSTAVIDAYCYTTTYSSCSRITWNGSTFGVVTGKENHPMVMVSWYGAVAYCNWRSAMKGKPLCYDLSTWTSNWGSGYRLPTEAEWEKAARGGSAGHRFPWSDTDIIQHARANYYSTFPSDYDTGPTHGYHPTFITGNDPANDPYTSPVGYFAPNGYGLYDMAGNVREWCNDWWGGWYDSSPSSNPRGPASGTTRYSRGGCWFDQPQFCRVAYRYNTLNNDDGLPWGGYPFKGFRCVARSP